MEENKSLVHLFKEKDERFMGALLQAQGEKAYAEGLKDGGAASLEMTPARQRDVANWRSQQTPLIQAFTDELAKREFSDAEIANRASMWVNRALKPVYYMGLAEGDDMQSDKSLVHLFKEKDERFMILLSSNAYLDREEEIVKQKALELHVKDFDPEIFHPLLFWHGGEPIGQIVEARMAGPFLFELAKEMANTIIDLAREEGEAPFFVSRRAVWDSIEDNPKQWGVSIGFKHHEGDEKDGAFDSIFKMESSILPHEDAANAVTLSQIIRS